MAPAVHARSDAAHHRPDAPTEGPPASRMPQASSGTYALYAESGPRHRLSPLPSAPTEAIPSFGSISDGVETSINDVVADLARLSDATSVPRLLGAVPWSELSPLETWVACLVNSRMSLAAIVQTSPLGEDETLGLLAGLIARRTITLLD